MRVNVVDKGGSRYIAGEWERFDQKNDTFNRLIWDASLAKVGQDFIDYKRDFNEILKKNKPGFTLQDIAFMDASWRVERDFGGGNLGGNYGLYSWETKGYGGKMRESGAKLAVDEFFQWWGGLRPRVHLDCW